jgi:sucrose-6-phosphate hydrolase SacC (GH32 family)
MNSPLAFHAAPPDGTWINDPNGLVHAGGQWRLFAQHRADAPDFRATGWARFSSPDLLRWTFDGAAMPPDGTRWNYSGCVLSVPGSLEAVHTLHDQGEERQVRRTSTDDGATWSEALDLSSLGAPARNRRDPFLFAHGGAWYALLAEPCDWTGWEGAPPSRLCLYRSADRRSFELVGRIGPWSPAGVMWEVPLLLFVGGRAVLVVSVVDRRGGGAATGVRAWTGRFTETGFERDLGAEPEGTPVDFGPDFYAMMTAAGTDAPLAVGWLSGWGTARRMPWPGFGGGPISLPREPVLVGGRLGLRAPQQLVQKFSNPVPGPVPGGMACAVIPGHADFTLDVQGESASLKVAADPGAGSLAVQRRGAAELDWSGEHALAFAAAAQRTLRLFVDGPVVELFLDEDAVAVSAAIAPVERPLAVRLRSDGTDMPLAWFRPEDAR